MNKKRIALGLVFGLALSAAAHAVPADKGVAMPEGVTTEQNPQKQQFIEKAASKAALFRPSDNMPEVVNADVIRGMAETGKQASGGSQFIGYLPKLKVLPCAEGCEGADYDRAVKEFVDAFSNRKHFKERGEMIVQVRWFNQRPFLQRQLPYGADIFGVSFLLEGKLVSLGKKSGVGTSIKARELAKDLGSRLGMELAFTLGMGVRPTFLDPMNEGAAAGMANGIMAAGTAVDGALGVENVRSRIEPATAENSKGLLGIDGIEPGEVAPIDKMQYINSLTF